MSLVARIPALLLVLAIGPLAAADFQPGSDEPTGAEVEILELMNRYRSDPAAEADRILGATDLPAWFWDGVDRGLFEREVKALDPAPPLVMDLDALRAARRHSYYMIHNGLGHDEQAGKEGYTGRTFSDRMKAAGFTGNPAAENCFAQAADPWVSHAGFIVDRGPGGSGGMQPGRGHRMNMIKDKVTVVGPGAVERSGGGLSVTHNFGTLKRRFAGGAMYIDRDGDEFFDAGEGLGGVVIRSADGTSVQTWASGGYTLPIGSGGGSMIAEYQGVTQICEIPPGQDNVHFTWRIPQTAELEAADRLLAAVAEIPDDDRHQRQRREALVELWLGTRGLSLDASRSERVETLAGRLGNELEAARSGALAAIASGDGDRIEAALAAKRDWRGTRAGDWFAEAAVLAKASAGVLGYERAVDAGQQIPEAAMQRLRSTLEATRERVRFPDIRAAFTALLSRVPAAD